MTWGVDPDLEKPQILAQKNNRYKWSYKITSINLAEKHYMGFAWGEISP